MVIKLVFNTPKNVNGLLFALFILRVMYTLNCVNATDHEKCIRQPFPIDQDNQKDRRYLLSEGAPTANILRNHTEWQEDIDPMIRLMKKIVKGIDQRREDSLEKCNLPEVNGNWVYTARIQARYLQIGDLSDSCYSQLHGANAVKEGLLSRDDVDTAMDVIGTGVQTLYKSISNIAESPQKRGWGNWTHSFPLRDWKISDESQTCELESFSAYRKNDSFFLRAAMTNHHVNKFVEDRMRQFVNEWIRDDYSESIRMIQPNHTDKQQFVEGTTLLTEWAARAWISWHGEMQDDANPAIRTATEQNAIEVDLADDSIVPSNVALLALPMIMSLIPVAFIAELGSLGTVLYIIFTDVIAVIPFLIKGIELWGTTQSHTSLVAYYAGDEKLADLQVWVAKCRGTEKFKYIGLTFIVIAIATVAIGILLEIQAMKYMRRKRENSESLVTGPFGRAMFDSTADGLLGTGFAEKWERYSISSFQNESLKTTETDVTSSGEDESETSKERWISSTLKWISGLFHSPTNYSYHTDDASTLGRENNLEEIDIFNACAGVGKDGTSSAERFQIEGYESFGGDGSDGNV